MKLVVLASVLAMVATAVSAQESGRDFTLSVRGGIASAQSSYPFAFRLSPVDPLDPLAADIEEIFDASYGTGPFFSVSLSTPDVFRGFGAEIGLSQFRLEGDATAGSLFGSPDFADLISLSHDRSYLLQLTSSTTTATNLRALLTYDLPNYEGAQLLGGLAYLNFDHNSAGQTIFPGDRSSQSRSATFEGAGLLFGARQNFPDAWNGFDLRLEGLVGRYQGSRTLSISDSFQELGSPTPLTGELDVSQSQAAHSLDLSASVLRPAPFLSPNAQIEFGVTYRMLFDVIDTSNYNQAVLDEFGEAGRTGDVDDDFATAAIFVGLTVPF